MFLFPVLYISNTFHSILADPSSANVWIKVIDVSTPISFKVPFNRNGTVPKAPKNEFLDAGDKQKGCWKGAQGTNDQLFIDEMILKERKARKKNLALRWIDYKKAYDMIPHPWILFLSSGLLLFGFNVFFHRFSFEIRWILIN